MNYSEEYFDKKIKSSLKNFFILSCCLIPITLICLILVFLYKENSKSLIYSASILNALMGFYGFVYFSQSLSFHKFRKGITNKIIPKVILVLSIIVFVLSSLAIMVGLTWYLASENGRSRTSGVGSEARNILNAIAKATNIIFLLVSIPLTALSYITYKKQIESFVS